MAEGGVGGLRDHRHVVSPQGLAYEIQRQGLTHANLRSEPALVERFGGIHYRLRRVEADESGISQSDAADAPHRHSSPVVEQHAVIAVDDSQHVALGPPSGPNA